MSQTDILIPAMALAGWTLCVLILIPYQAFKATLLGHIKLNDLKPGVSAIALPQVSIPNRNFMNLLEVPVLFYFVSVVVFVTQSTDQTIVYLAWAYFSLRILHSLVHLTYNKVIHRGLVFAASNGVLLVILAKLFIVLANK